MQRRAELRLVLRRNASNEEEAEEDGQVGCGDGDRRAHGEDRGGEEHDRVLLRITAFVLRKISQYGREKF